MTYVTEEHKQKHQVKVTLDEQDFRELKIAAARLRLQHSVLGRSAINWVVDYFNEHGSLPPGLEAEIGTFIDQRQRRLLG